MKLLILLFLFCASSFGAHAETMDDEALAVPKLGDIFLHLPSDIKTFGKETFTKENAPLLGGLLLMTSIEVTTDFEIWQVHRAPFLELDGFHKISNMGVSMGDGFFQFGIVGAFLADGILEKNRRGLRTAAQITESILATGIVVQLVKHVTGRESPFSSEERTGVWRVFPDQLEFLKDFQKFDAMPSGHLSTAITTFVVIQENYPEQKWIPYVGYPIMAWISVGLVATSIHWFSDFPIAAAMGYSFGKIVTRGNHRTSSSLPEGQSRFEPLILPAFSSRGEPILVAGWEF